MRLSLKVSTLALWKLGVFGLLLLITVYLIGIINTKYKFFISFFLLIFFLIISTKKQSYFIFNSYEYVLKQLKLVLDSLAMNYSISNNSLKINNLGMMIKMLRVGPFTLMNFSQFNPKLEKEVYIKTTILKYQRL